MASIFESRIETLVDQALKHEHTNPKDAVAAATQAVDMAAAQWQHQPDVEPWLGYAEAALSSAYSRLEQHETALEIGLAALERLNRLSATRGLEIALAAVSFSQFRQGNSSISYQYAQELLHLSRRTDNWRYEARAHQLIALVHQLVGDVEQNLSHLQTSLALGCEHDDAITQIISVVNLASAYVTAQRYEDALEAGQQGLSLTQADQHKGIRLFILANMTDAYLRLDRVDEAQAAVESMAALSAEIDSPVHQGIYHSLAGELLMYQQQYEAARQHLAHSLALGQTVRMPQMIREAHKRLHQVYEKLDDIPAALHHFKAYHEQQMRVMQQDAQAQVKVLSAISEAELAAQKTAELGEFAKELTYAVARQQDLADRLKRALAKANESLEQKQRISQTISHEFRTPLTVINTNLHLLSNYASRLTPEKMQHYLDSIGESTRRLSDVVDDMLLIEGFNSDGSTPKRQPIMAYQLPTILTASLEHDGSHVERIQFVVEDNVRTVTLQSDAKALQKLGAILLSNALLYSDQMVSVTISAENEAIDVQVNDNGIGIPPEDQQRIFGLLERGTNVGSRRGVGLGLYIAHMLSQQLDIGLRAQSDGIDQGSCFTLTLPMR